ncbi:MAG: selenium-dependent molybdenum cofactor biosynthesis protein YqeB [Eubacteriales bacterium]|jgi:xanthine dehydrogenase accessory factor|nr:selenium-dependent molybdenum cofactor biosynthesis protein YqeB [Eubacteriales bacterium]
MIIWVRGAGDIATGVAFRLHKSGFSVVMSDLAQPTSIRRTICFSEAIIKGETTVEDITARFAENAAEAKVIINRGEVAVLADPIGESARALNPVAVIDAILAKRNLGTMIDDAEIVVGIGPGFTAGVDCHAVVETMRGHTLGRVYYNGSALPDTGIPGNIAGFTLERLLRAPRAGVFRGIKQIGDVVEPNEVCAYVDGEPVISRIHGVLRGLLPDGITVYEGMKSGDVDPRCEILHCFTVSDKALSIGGGALEAVLHRLSQGGYIWKQK